uniref:Uncharacterized protein n=1 Tax=viral metagenome TaxID=1070528 RepID=A0A6C0I563_9ZZZZ
MENTFTRISELPEGQGPPAAISVSNNGYDKSQSIPTNYVPINTHPNPYIGAPNTNTGPALQPLQPLQQQQQLSLDDRATIQQQQAVRLPSRDIVQDTTEFTHDEQIKPNFIPKANVSSDYVRDYQDMTERNVREHEEKKSRLQKLDDLLTEMQIPIFVTVLFLVFQLPIINTLIFKRLAFLPIYAEDGNFNFYGYIFKSLIFGCSYYGVLKFTNYFSN